MNEAKKKVIVDLTYKMIIEPSQGFPPHEFEESVKLFMEIVKSLLEEDYQKDNNEAKKKVIIDLTYKMIIEPSQGFPPHEFEESVKLYMEIVKSLLGEQYQKDNI